MVDAMKTESGGRCIPGFMNRPAASLEERTRRTGLETGMPASIVQEAVCPCHTPAVPTTHRCRRGQPAAVCALRAIPRSVAAMDDFPLTARAKVQTDKLRERSLGLPGDAGDG